MIQRINLYTRDLRPRSQRLTGPGAIGAIGLAALLPLAVSGFMHWQNQQLDQQVAQVSARNIQLEATVLTLTEQLAQHQPDPALEAALKRIADTISRRERLLERVDDLTTVESPGFSPQLAALARQVPDKLWLTRVSLSGPQQTILLEGKALAAEQVPVYLARLGDEPVFAGQTFADFQLQRPDSEPDGPQHDPQVIKFRVATAPGQEVAQ
ncbi:MAG TPA: PilN domain-containing protein [Marinobacter sp.]|nr:PilN domain-containing protein [Marinobacter sp.]